jgi:hypothetical protein
VGRAFLDFFGVEMRVHCDCAVWNRRPSRVERRRGVGRVVATVVTWFGTEVEALRLIVKSHEFVNSGWSERIEYFPATRDTYYLIRHIRHWSYWSFCNTSVLLLSKCTVRKGR